MQITTISPADMQVLKRIANTVLSQPEQQPLRRDMPQEPFQSNDVYIALIPGGGLPARVGLNPGRATCAIYRMFLSDALTPTLTVVGVLTQVVYNLSTDDVDDGEYLPVVLDKFGHWLAVAPGGGGGSEPVPGEMVGTLSFGTSAILSVSPAGKLSLPTITVTGVPTWTPVAGTYPVIWNKFDGMLYVWNGTAWKAVSSSAFQQGYLSRWTVEGTFIASSIYDEVGRNGVLFSDGLALDVSVTPLGGATYDNYDIAKPLTIISSNATITGLESGNAYSGQVIGFIVTGGTATFAHNSGGSSAGNKFLLPGAVNLLVASPRVVYFTWDGTNWYCETGATGGVGGSGTAGTIPVFSAGTTLADSTVDDDAAAGAMFNQGIALNLGTAGAGTIHDYDAGGKPISGCGGNTITGIDSTDVNSGQLVAFFTTAGGGTTTFKHSDTGSAAANRFLLPGSTDLVLPENHGVIFFYTGVRWQCLAGTI